MGSRSAQAPHFEADLPSGGGALEGVSKPARWRGMAGSALSRLPCREGSRPNCAVPGAGSRTGENPPYGIRGRAAENVARGAGLRPTAKAVDSPPDPNVGASVLYPTAKRRPADPSEGNRWSTSRLRTLSTELARIVAGTLFGMAKLSVEEPDALMHARPGPWEPWRVTARATQPSAPNPMTRTYAGVSDRSTQRKALDRQPGN